MKKTELIDVIRKIIREEVRTQLPAILIESLSNSAPKPNVETSIVTEQRTVSKPSVQSKPAVDRQFSKNPLLNKVLNETVGGVPQDDISNESTITDEMLESNPELNAVNEAITRDYRGLIKAIDAKKRR